MFLQEGTCFHKVYQTSKQIIETITPLTHTTSSKSLNLTQQAKNIISSLKSPISVVCSIGFNDEFFNNCRKMFLLDTGKLDKNTIGQAKLYGKPQLSQQMGIQWLYSQLKLKVQSTDQPVSPIKSNESLTAHHYAVFLSASLLILELNNTNELNSQAKIINEIVSMVQIDSFHPKVVCIIRTDKISDQQCRKRIKISKEIKILRSNQTLNDWQFDQMMRREGKQLVNAFRTKNIQQQPLTSNLLQMIWEMCITQQFLFSVGSFCKNLIVRFQFLHESYYLDQYENKIRQLIGNQHVNYVILKEALLKAKEQTSKTIIKYGFSSKFISKIFHRMQEKQRQFIRENQKAIVDWGRNLLKQCWSNFQTRINKQNLPLLTIKQQFNILIDFFKKKTQNFGSFELSNIMYENLMPKMWEIVSLTYSSMTTNYKEKIISLEHQLQNCQNQSKEIKKKISKQDSEILRKSYELKEKLAIAQTRLLTQQKNIQSLRSQINENAQKHQQKVNNLSHQFRLDLQSKNKKISELEQQIITFQQKITVLTSQLSRQRLLHRQTKNHYEQAILSLQGRQSKVREQLQQVSLTASRQIDFLKKESIDEIGQTLQNNRRLKLQLQDLQFNIKSKEDIIQNLRQQIVGLRKNTVKNEDINSQYQDLQLKYALIQDKLAQNDLLKTKILKKDEQLKKVIKQKQTISDSVREYETKALVTAQRSQYFEQLLKSEQTRIRQLQTVLHTLKAEKDEIKNNKNTLTDGWAQANDQTVRQRLKQALKMIRALEEDCSRLRGVPLRRQ